MNELIDFVDYLVALLYWNIFKFTWNNLNFEEVCGYTNMNSNSKTGQEAPGGDAMALKKAASTQERAPDN